MASAIVTSVQITGLTAQVERPLDHSVLIELTVDENDLRSVQLKRGEMPVVDHSLHPPLYLRHGSVLHLQIREKHRLRRDHQILSQSFSPETIWLASSQSIFDNRTKNFPIHLKDPKQQIWLNVVELPSTPVLETSGSSRGPPVTENVSRIQEKVEGSSGAASQNVVQKLGEFKTALEHLGRNQNIVESFNFEGITSELCTRSRAVFDSVNTFHEQIKTRSEEDQELLELAINMERTVNLLQLVKDIAKLNELKKTLKMFFDLMTKTVDLIQTWAGQSELAEVVLTQQNKNKIDDLKKCYTIFEKEFDRGLQLDAAMNKYSSLGPRELKELKDVLLDGVKAVNPKAIPCITGTRTTILEEIETKIDDPDSANILWIRGAPGSGKSALSLSIKSQLLDQRRLVAYYRFDRNESTITTAIGLWRRIAYNLACQFPAVGTRILQQLQDPNFEFDSPMAVFTSLVETPLSKLIDLPIVQSPVIVIDALDECGGYDGRFSSERKELLQTLKYWSRLPRHFKLLVTSREESDITQALSTISTPIHIPSGTSLFDNQQHPASIAVSDDIRTFLEYRFSEIRTRLGIVGDWPGTKMIGGMVHRAAGNFMWATAAANFIDEGVDPEDRLDRIMSDASSSSSMGPLYSLYCTILETAFGKVADNDTEAVTLRAVLGTMICAKRTLSDDEYTKLPTQHTISTRTLASIRYSLGPVIVADGNLRFVHKSFDDFLRSPQCPVKFAVDIDRSHHLLTNLCLATMAGGLQFNLCNLETSCLKNTDVPDIETKVADGIPPLLSYSCFFWADHLSLAPSNQHLMNEVRAVVMDKLLYWFEAMSLLKEINRVSPSLLLVLKWFHSSPDEEFKEFLSDARRFIAAFGSPIAQSAPHIYISALPFAPENSSVAQHYLPQFPRTLALTEGRPTSWPSCIFRLKLPDNHGPVLPMTLSPDERYIALGSLKNKTMSVSDSETGNLISGPFDVDCIFSTVFFDPNGRYVWAASYPDGLVGFDIETGEKHHDLKVGRVIGCCHCNGDLNIISVEDGIVALWDADTGKWLCDLSMGINSSIYLPTLSPNGGCIAGVSVDDYKTVRMWKLVDGSEIQLVQGPSVGQPRSRPSDTVAVLSFSVDSNFVVSGWPDGTIQIWDVRIGEAVGAPLSTGRHGVQAVAYSHENRRLISLDYDDTATVWNTITCKAAPVPLNDISSIALSRDGQSVFLGTLSGEVMKWDLDRKGNVLAIQSNDPHDTPNVPHFACSPLEGVLESHQESGVRVLAPFSEPRTYPSVYSKLILSPDESQIATCSSHTSDVRVLNAETGELVFYQKFDSDIIHLAFRSTDRRLVACSDLGKVYVWNLEDSIPPPVVAALPRILALSPDGSTAIVLNADKIPPHYMWNTITHQSLPLTLADDDNVGGITDTYYSSTGLPLAVTFYGPNPWPFVPASANTNLHTTSQLWNTQTRELTTGPSTIHGQINCLAFSPDNTHIAYSLCSDNTPTIWIWSTCADPPISSFWTVHTSRITALDFSPDGARLVSGSEDGRIRIWNTADLLGDSPVPVEFMHGCMDPDGWVLAAGESLGFWVPPDHRENLVWNGNVAVLDPMHRGTITRLDLVRFRFGEKWMECFEEGR